MLQVREALKNWLLTQIFPAKNQFLKHLLRNFNAIFEKNVENSTKSSLLKAIKAQNRRKTERKQQIATMIELNCSKTPTIHGSSVLKFISI